MLGEMPIFFTLVAIKSKTKPMESMVPPYFALAVPLLDAPLHAPTVNSFLKRITMDLPSSTSNPSEKAKKSAPKKKTQVLARDSTEEVTQSQWIESQVSPVARPTIGGATYVPAGVVNLDTSTTISDKDLGRPVDLDMGNFSLREEMETPFPLCSSTPQTKEANLEEEIRRSVEKLRNLFIIK
ncbi:hypothetical protein LIER_06485 [Lithospermum erythrorhizon]|uniref:Uncharacterized protein n=1 Tax=Lithospermum erythrorhizon TaxID=34254 RepID=A0AAV3P5T6_LITER